MAIVNTQEIDRILHNQREGKKDKRACTHPRPRFGKTKRDKANGAWFNRFENRQAREARQRGE